MNIVIVGAGDIGFHLCERLSFEKNDITLIDTDPQKVEHAKEHLDANIIEGSGASINILQTANVENAEIFAALTNNDEVNIIACQIAKKMGVPTTILRVRNPEYLSENNIFNKNDLGADFIIQPEQHTANAIVQLIRQANATDIIEIEEGKVTLIGVRLDKNCSVLNTPLVEIGNKFGNPPLRILAIKRKLFTIIPKGNDKLLNGDQIYLICDKEYLPEALKHLGKENTHIENIMIIGGGLVTQFIAQELEREISIKIIESNEKKANLLAEKLKNALVINGDGSDIDLLMFEGLTDMDEFIAASSDDEKNLITSLIARHLQIPRTITVVRKMEYVSLTHAIGLDAVVNKQMITVNVIKQIIRRRKLALFAEIPSIDAEIMEFIAHPNSKITKYPLYKIDFPNDAIVGAVIKPDNSLIIPRGNTQIEPDDKVIVFTLPKSLNAVEKLF